MLVCLHQDLQDLPPSFKAAHFKYRHFRTLAKQLYKLILECACHNNVGLFTSTYNSLYNHLHALSTHHTHRRRS